MSFNLVTGRKGEAHVTSTQFRDIVRAIVGKDTYIPNVNEGLQIEQTTANTITVSSGVLIHHGCVFEIPYGDSVALTIDTPAEGVNKAYKICVDWSVNNGIETGVLQIVSAAAPGLDEGNMQEGDTHDNVVIADVTVTGLTVTVTPRDANPKPTGIVDMVYPVGSIYMSVNPVNPSTFFGGSWAAWGSGRVPVGVDTSDTSFNTVEKTGGEKTHTLTTAEIPSHTHSAVPLAAQRGNIRMYLHANVGFNSGSEAIYSMESGSNDYPTSATGGGSGHNIVQPYITCYMWKRIG